RKRCEAKGCKEEFFGLAFGQSPFNVPAPIAKALGKNAERAHYSEAEGIVELRDAIAGFNKRHFGLDVDPGRIVVGPGTKDLIHLIFDIVKGSVVIPSPSWIGYSPQIKLLDKNFHVFNLRPEANYKIRPDDLDGFLAKLPDRQLTLILNNPHNPTGALYSRKELEGIANVCRNRNTFVLSDEIYALTTYDFDKFTSMGLAYPEGTFVTNGLSKDRSAGGYRLGACILPRDCPQKLIDAFKKVATTIYTNVSTPVQYAAITAYKPNKKIEENFRITREIHRIMGHYMSAEFNKIDGIKATKPQGGFYFFADFNELSEDLKRERVRTSNELAHSMMSHPHHIATITGASCLLAPNDYGARIAYVDYNGQAAYEVFQKAPPKSSSEEPEFVKDVAPRMVKGVEAVKAYVEHIKRK
ncbi:MAG: aminotransferase class I/II-fold pyridoxal phosphate-dependent enzyme, partial [Thermoplasmata archaeon]|nr:aminotransferase class I/II-fold pyridoxal phosphate-dependent enzyme [Thermoplasmata archaeon]